MTLRAYFLAILAIGVAPSLAEAQRGDLDSREPESIELPAELDAVLRAYETGWRAGDAQHLAALFTEDGFVLRPGSPPSRGRAQIRDAYEGSGGPLALRAYDYAVDGSVAYIIGGYAGTEDGVAAGKFVLTLRRSASGWLISADMDNGNSR